MQKDTNDFLTSVIVSRGQSNGAASGGGDIDNEDDADEDDDDDDNSEPTEPKEKIQKLL